MFLQFLDESGKPGDTAFARAGFAVKAGAEKSPEVRLLNPRAGL